jgi:hypothetical protein
MTHTETAVKSAHDYLRLAAEAQSLVDSAGSPEARAAILQIAETWLILANAALGAPADAAPGA